MTSTTDIDTMTTITAVQFDQDRKVSLVELPLPTIAEDEVLVRSRVVGLCRSDLELLHGHLDHQLGINEPVIPGHEWSGEVAAVGAKVTHLQPGDPVVGECVLAPNTWFGFDYPGAGAQFFRAPARLLHKLPSSLTFHQGALIEPFTIAYKGIRTAGGCDASDIVVIIGAGMVGLAAAAIATANKATTIVIEPSPRRRELASALGADHTLDPRDITNPETTLTDLTGHSGATLVIEASGSAAGLASTFTYAAHAGRVLNIGICADPTVNAPIALIQAKDLTIYGTTGSSDIWPAAMEFMQRHQIRLDDVITATYPLHKAHDAISAADDPTNVKVHIEMQDTES